MKIIFNLALTTFFLITFSLYSVAGESENIEKSLKDISLSMDINQMKRLEILLSELVKKNPKDFTANLCLGKLYFLMSEYFELNSENEKGKNWESSEKYLDNSLIYLNNSIKINENFFDSHFYKLFSLIHKIRHFTGWMDLASIISTGKSATKEKEILLALEKDSPKRYLAEGISILFKPDSRGGGPVKARPQIEQAIKLDPSYDDAYFWLAKTYVFKDSKDKEPERAKEYLKKALQLSPKNNKYKIELVKIK